MNDEEKRATREEFVPRFWRLVLAILLLSAIIVWLWFEDPRLKHYLWFSVIPLMFLVPLLRYHRAVRSLTQAAADSFGPVGVMPVDDAVKLRIRRLATRMHWFVQAFLVLMIMFGVFARWGFGKLADTYLDMQSFKASGLVIGQFSHFFFGRGRELIPFTPPAKLEEREAWAVRIEDQLGQPVAVFVSEKGAVNWARRNDSLARGMSAVPRLFEANLTREERGEIDTVGAFEMRRISNLDTAKEGFRIWMVGPLESDQRWGVVLSYGETWNAFFAELKNAEKMNPRDDSPAWPIKEVVYLGGTDANELTGMRVLRKGEVVFASPKLDTTRHVRRIESAPTTWEYYSSERDERYAKFIRPGPVSWRNFVAWIVLMAVLYGFYRWIRKLTEPAH